LVINHSEKCLDATLSEQRKGNLRGMVFAVLSGFVLMGSFGMARHVSGELHAFEVAFFRTFLGLLFLVPWFLRSGTNPFKTARLGMHVSRSALHSGASLSFFFALTIAPFAEITALYFISPVFVTVMAVVFLREVVGLQRWAAVLIGFAGMLVILRPGIEALELGSSLAILSAMFGSCSVVLTKGLARTESVMTISAYTMTLMTLFLLIPALFVWEWPSLAVLPWLVLIGAGGGLGNFLFASSIKAAEISVITPLSFLQLVWAAAIGFLFFGEVPEIFVWIGGLMIFAATTYIAIRERSFAKSEPQTSPV
jgi:drug/metabolite transporter (DMT)-like permease